MHPKLVAPSTEIEYRLKRTRYRITVTNPDRQCKGVREASLDGAPADANAIPIVDDGKTHEVRIVLGRVAS